MSPVVFRPYFSIGLALSMGSVLIRILVFSRPAVNHLEQGGVASGKFSSRRQRLGVINDLDKIAMISLKIVFQDIVAKHNTRGNLLICKLNCA